jgi:hypothetical protein
MKSLLEKSSRENRGPLGNSDLELRDPPEVTLSMASTCITSVDESWVGKCSQPSLIVPIAHKKVPCNGGADGACGYGLMFIWML